MFSAGVLPIRYSPFTIRHSLLAIRCRFTIRRSHSLLATRCRFGSAGASPSQLIPSLVPRPTTRFNSALSFLRHQLRTKVRLACKRA